MSHSLIRLIIFGLVFVGVTVSIIVIAFLGADPNSVSAIASVLVAATTLVLAIVTWDSVYKADKRDEEERHALARPQLVPMSIPEIENLINVSERPIDIQNVGTGVANNVWGVMLPHVEPTNQVPPQLSMRNSVPLPAGAIKTMLFTAGGYGL